MTPSIPTGLYGIADASFGDPVSLGRALARGGARIVQLRAKDWSTIQRVAACRALVEHLSPLQTLVMMNDDLDAAVAGGAHGLHLGQSDGSLEEARKRLGPDAVLGRSTHSLLQVDTVDPQANYIGFGPVFATQTKAGAGPARGLEQLALVLTRSRVPVVAIGGIQLENLELVRSTGARHWAVISDILGDSNIAAQARRFAEPAP